MAAITADALYEREIRVLPVGERLRLLARIAADLVDDAAAPTPKRSILELDGLGAELWAGIDAQEYVDQQREEWDRHP